MPVSTVTYTANGSTNQFSITFPYIDAAHVLVSVNDASASFTFHNSTTVQLSSTPTSGQTVVVYRQTPSSALVDFTDGSTLFESDLDLANTQARYLSEEARDRADSAITTVTANKANIDTVAGIAGNVTTVAGANANIATVAGANSNITTVVGNLTNINTVAGINSNISSVAGNASNITAVANDATDIGVVAGKATEISALGTPTNITNMATLGASGVVADIATVAGVAPTMTAAATNATNAAASASAAANSAAAAAASFDTFDDRYLGSKSSEPSVDNDGNALVSGALFFDSAVGSMKVYDGGNWILATSAGAASLLDYEFTATAGQTTFTGADNNSASLSYSAGNLIVTLNGIVLDNGSDYTATSGTSIVLASGAAAGDHLAVVAFKSFTVADTVAASTGGTFAGGVTVSGTMTANSAAINANGSGGTTGIHVNKNDINGYFLQAEFDGGTNNGRTYNLKPPSSDSSNEPFTWSTGNSHAWEVDGSEVLRIGSSKAIGLSGANYGTAGQVLTSAGSDAAPSWVAASGGGEQTFTATGAIANGDIVGMNANATISKMTQLTSSTPFPSINADAKFYATTVAYDSTNNKSIVLYLDDTNGDNPYVAIGTLSGMSLSFGTPVQVANVDTAQDQTKIVFDSNAGKFVVFYAVSNAVKCKVGTVSGTSCSFGPEATVQSGTTRPEMGSFDACYDSGSDKIIFFGIVGGTVAQINVGDISGTSISWGSKVSVGIAASRQPRVTYDSVANKVICTYVDHSATGYPCYYRVCTVSGTSISLGTQGTVANTSTTVSDYGMIDIEYCSARDRLFVVGDFGTPGDLIYVASLSGTTLTFGTPIASPVAFGGGGALALQDSPDFGGVLLGVNYYYNMTFVNMTCTAGTTNPVAYSAKQITGDQTTGTAVYYYGAALAYDTTANKAIYATMNDTDGDNPTAVVFDTSVPDRWIGLAAEAISNGASGKVTIIGGINTGQSGLATGLEYKVSPTSATLITSDGAVVGVATSASSIYLTKAEIL